MDRIEFKFDTDLKFDKDVYKYNYERYKNQFIERANFIVAQRELRSNLGEIQIVYGNYHTSLVTLAINNKHKWTLFANCRKSSLLMTEVFNNFKKRAKLFELVGKIE